MQVLKRKLRNKLRNAARIAILGIGSELRGDDAAGMLVAKRLSDNFKDLSQEKLKIFFGATAPENLSGEIKKFKPTHLVIIDSADSSLEPGSVKLLNLEDIGGISFSTHRMPLKILADYLSVSLSCDICFIGIQPKVIDFGVLPSKEVENSVKLVSDLLKNVMEN